MLPFPVRHWGRKSPLAWLLWPLSLLMRVVVGLRRQLYARGILMSGRLPVPLVVVGNIHVGGVGKTPLTLYLLQALREAGWRPGVISRGYGRASQDVRVVSASSSAADCGDEPLLVHVRSGCPVVVGRDRLSAGRLLLQQFPDTDLIISDDGLQHYRLQRDIELCVLDGLRGWGNGFLLPAGPLREPPSRLRSVSALIVHGDAQALPGCPADAPCFHMHLQPGEFYRLQSPQQRLSVADLQGRHLLAVAGIGSPERFFNTLRQLGLQFDERPFADHHQFSADDLRTDADIILMTEKDAVKCRGLDSAKIVVLPVSAAVHPDLGGWLVNHPRLHHGRKTA